MATGLALPIRVTHRGGAALISGTPLTEQMVTVGLAPNRSKNPFQAGAGVELGLSERLIFSGNDPATRGIARREIIRAFSRWRTADLARLASGSRGLSFESEGGDLIARISYIDLEADAERTVIGRFSRGRGTAFRVANGAAQ